MFDLNKDLTIDKREFTAICALNDKLSGIRYVTVYFDMQLDSSFICVSSFVLVAFVLLLSSVFIMLFAQLPQ